MKANVVIIVAAVLLATVAGLPEAREDLWRRGEMLASEDFSGGMADWMPEGDVEARVEDGRLRFEATGKTPEKKGNIWWKHRFSGPILIEFDYQSATEHGLTMFWFNSHGRGGADLLSIPRNGRYDDYVKGPMNGYHVSFHRFGSGVCNLRKSYGFHMLASSPDPIAPADLDPHHLEVYAAGGRIRVSVDGELVHEVTDSGDNCIEGDSWLHDYPCSGTGEIWRGGYLGVRHTQSQAAYYDNFRVYRLEQP
ncbi:MAG: DUF1961 family protein [Candidatus Glassbacteria bacterium]|nr:DUF1961 family protein [Candidatus Glassbacteria bacterium]